VPDKTPSDTAANAQRLDSGWRVINSFRNESGMLKSPT
jgi:hypothetical protein